MKETKGQKQKTEGKQEGQREAKKEGRKEDLFVPEKSVADFSRSDVKSDPRSDQSHMKRLLLIIDPSHVISYSADRDYVIMFLARLGSWTRSWTGSVLGVIKASWRTMSADICRPIRISQTKRTEEENEKMEMKINSWCFYFVFLLRFVSSVSKIKVWTGRPVCSWQPV